MPKAIRLQRAFLPTLLLRLSHTSVSQESPTPAWPGLSTAPPAPLVSCRSPGRKRGRGVARCTGAQPVQLVSRLPDPATEPEAAAAAAMAAAAP